MNYEKSVELVLSLGYKKVTDNKAFKGCYLIKNNKKCIHDIDTIMQYLNIKLYKDLEKLGYDLENYHHYKDYINEMAKQEMQQIYTNITHENGQPTYMYDGVWLYPDGTMKER
jgi:hypothetical protein